MSWDAIRIVFTCVFISSWCRIITWICLLIVLPLVAALVYDSIYSPPKIKGVFSIPGELPVVGHLHLSSCNPSKIYMDWARQYSKSVFQIRLGSRRVIVVNSYDDVVDIWMNHSCQNNSRPMSYTFHGLVSSYQKFTVGSTPQSATYKRKKRAVSQLLNCKSVSSRNSTICSEIEYILHKLVSEATNSDVELVTYLKYFALRCSVFLMYGLHLDCFGEDNALCKEIIYIESEIIKLRSPISNLEDSVPFMKYFPPLTNAQKAKECGHRREKYMSELYTRFQEGAKEGNSECMNSFVGQLLIEEGSKRLSDAEIYSICLTFISAGLDNTPLNLNYLIGILSQPITGVLFQTKAINCILDHSHGDAVKAWELSNKSDLKNVYVHALVLETLRQFSVLPLSLPRTTTKSFTSGDIEIPAGSHLFMNAYAANHDEGHFDNPFEFRPERWIDDNSQINFATKVNQHFAFGAGSRMCSGNGLALRQMYIFMVKFLLMFEVHPPDSNLMVTDPFLSNGNALATSFEPRSHNVKLTLRNSEKIHGMALKS